VKRAWALTGVVLISAGCSMTVAVDPSGYRCDPGGGCPGGYVCVADLCQRSNAELCAGVTCVQQAECVGSAKVKTFVGACVTATGACTFEGRETSCVNGCASGSCINACMGVSCTTPPGPVCMGSTLHSYQPNGSCNSITGACEYTLVERTCTNGCTAGACVNQNLCDAVTCHTPPPAVCDGLISRSFAVEGVCTAGICAYQATEVTCPESCLSGACVSNAATFKQTGPRLHFAITALDVAPSSNGNLVVVVGKNGNLARWNGSEWAVLTTPSNESLNAVHFVTNTAAWVVGANRTVWSYRNGVVTAAGSVPGPANANLISVYGRGDANVLIADETGDWYKWSGSSWAHGTFPSGRGPFSMTSVFIDETNRERVGGRCGSASNLSCIAYREPSSGLDWSIDNDRETDSGGCRALGPWVDAPIVGFGPDVLCGKPNNQLRRHAAYGFPAVALAPVPSLAEGSGVVGVSGGAARGVYALTSSGGAAGVGGLYRLARAVTVSSTELITTHFGEEHLSLNDGSTNAVSSGVVVADVLRSEDANTVIRRGPMVNEAYDLAEDWASATVTGSSDLVLISTTGDVAIRANGSPVYSLVRGPPEMTVLAATAQKGTGVLITGSNAVTGVGRVQRYSPGLGFTEITTTGAGVTDFNGVCRVSDSEAYVVGNGGAIYSVSSATLSATKMTSGTTKNLFAVDCGSVGNAVACGQDGTVLRLNGGAWLKVRPTFPSMARLTNCKLLGDTIWVASEAAFARLESGAPAWSMLPVKNGLRGLFVRSPTDVYGYTLSLGATDLHRFDGSSWKSLLNVRGMVRGGVQAGPKIILGGASGLIIEGQ